MIERPLLIAGAGIAGLTLALALSRRGIPTRVLEKRDTLDEAGAGIQLGPNAMQVLARLGVGQRLTETAGLPAAIGVHDGASGARLATLPLGTAIERRFGAPYVVVHRADLHAALLAAARQATGVEIVTGFELARIEQDANTVHGSATDSRTIEGSGLAGADGLWSATRRLLFPGHPLTYAGKMAARSIIPAELAKGRFGEPDTGVWLSRDAHVVHYRVRGGRDIAVVAILDEASPREGWGGPIEATNVLARLIRFSPELIGFLGHARDWRVWSLYDPPPLPAWSRGRVGLLGDAAHPILPFLAQGGAMAIEDAETLAALIAATPADPAAAFLRYEALRRARVLAVQNASRANGRTFHLDGAMAIARNATLRLVPGSLLMRRYDWLYGWNGDPA